MNSPSKPISYLALAASLLLFGLTGCGGSGEENGDKEQNTDLRGTIEINGSSTVAPISTAAGTRFMKTYPNVKVTVNGIGTGDGFALFSQGKTDISGASRPIKPGELEDCKKSEIEVIELPVAYDGLTVVVHPELAIDEVTVDELAMIFGEETKPSKWNEVNPAWPDLEIKIYAPGDESGTYDYFTEAILKEKPIRGDYSPNKDDNALVTSIAGTKGAIGFFGASYYFGNKDKLKALKVINPKTGKPELPSKETIESGEYSPLSRPLFIYVNKKKLDQPQVRIFVEEYLEHAAELAEGVNYVALPDKIYDQAKANLKARKTGTHFIDPDDGKSRSGSLESIFKAENLNSGS